MHGGCMGGVRGHSRPLRAQCDTSTLCASLRQVDTTSFGSRLVALRLRNNMGQVDLAIKVRVPLAAVNDWEHDRAQPDAITLGRVCRELRCRPADLLDDDAPG